MIIKKKDAPVLPRADPLFVEPHCNFEPEKPTREGFDGPEFDWMPKLFRCTVCDELWKDASRQGKPLTRCEMWQHLEAKKAKEAKK